MMQGDSSRGRILFIDAYDSFTNNLSELFFRNTGAEIHIIHTDTLNIGELIPSLPFFDAIVIGPGPGSPENEQDVGVIKDIWSLSDEHLLPVFGVCLGFQSLCLHYGATIRRLRVVKHGQSSDIRHSNLDIFEGAGSIEAVRYHSLYAELNLPCPKHALQELAYAEDGIDNGQILMAVRHKSKPFWGVQYHPESICTTGGGDRVIRNFWESVSRWSQQHHRSTLPLGKDWEVAVKPTSLLQKIPVTNREIFQGAPLKVSKCSFYAPFLSIDRICELLGVESSRDFVLLESRASPGRFSIIGCLIPEETDIISYVSGKSYVTLSKVGGGLLSYSKVDLKDTYAGCIWKFIAAFMNSRRAQDGDDEIPFWGGLVGYLTYEAGVASLDVLIKHRIHDGARPDISLAFVQRSIVYDSATSKFHLQTIIPNDTDWLYKTRSTFQQEAQMSITPSATPPPFRASEQKSKRGQIEIETFSNGMDIVRPEKSTYISNVHKCQDELAAGKSYELCLTAPTKIFFSQPAPTPWMLYSRLRIRNPAPYAVYFSLKGSTIVGSSPERFLSWSRDGQCQLRPIKGTVRKMTADGRYVTRDEAQMILNTPKERAENLMIVDLIRHDLSGVAAKGSVKVSKLMEIEEYESVYQLVSVIEGNLDEKQRYEEGFTGFDILARSLPPGSMTGAPKKRSVELLQDIELTERGIYSGVLGYFSVCGGGDWSVLIRSAFNHEDDNAEKGKTCWTIGAGGAITALSSPEDEWEEMVVKLDSTQKAFAAMPLKLPV